MQIQGRNYAFVNFREVSSAVDALRSLSGAPIGGPCLRIEFAKAATPSNTLHVCNLSRAVSPDEWAASFSQLGRVQRLLFNSASASALLEYASLPEAVSAHNALLTFRGEGGRPLSVTFERTTAAGGVAGEAGGQQGADVLWVGLPPMSGVSEADLKGAFSHFPELKEVLLYAEKNFALLSFRGHEAAARALATMQVRVRLGCWAREAR